MMIKDDHITRLRLDGMTRDVAWHHVKLFECSVGQEVLWDIHMYRGQRFSERTDGMVGISWMFGGPEHEVGARDDPQTTRVAGHTVKIKGHL